MLYLTDINNGYSDYKYTLYEVYTNYIFKVSGDILEKLYNQVDIVNLYSVDGKFNIKEGYERFIGGNEYHWSDRQTVLIGRVDNKSGLILTKNSSSVTLDEDIIENRISKYNLNCNDTVLMEYLKGGDTEYDYEKITEHINEFSKTGFNSDGGINNLDYFDFKPSKEFEKHINEEYNRYLAKAKMLGWESCGFKYSIMGNEVILKSYEGSAEDVVLPNFITYIGSNAFALRKLNSIKLNSKIKGIGKMAFRYCGLNYIDIPQNVKFISGSAFIGNSKLYNNNEISSERVNIIGKHTIIV